MNVTKCSFLIVCGNAKSAEFGWRLFVWVPRFLCHFHVRISPRIRRTRQRRTRTRFPEVEPPTAARSLATLVIRHSRLTFNLVR